MSCACEDRGRAHERPPISISLDLDNLWSYLKTHGDSGWESFPSYLPQLAGLVLERLERHGLTLTFFVVGQDAALPRNREALGALASAGHSIGNHSFHHEPWLHLYRGEQIADEIDRAAEQIEEATGKRPRGFRGPGFSLSRETVRVLIDRGYLYDASTFPTFLGPLARAYYFWHSRGLSPEERKKRAQLFGGVRDGLRPIQPYMWHVEGKELLELPVTTLPFLRSPFHLSYLIYLARFSRQLGKSYLLTALSLCRLSGVEPSLLLHPLDFLGGDRVRELSFFPGMDLATSFKLDFFDEAITLIKEWFTPMNMEQHAASILRRALPRRDAGELDR